MHRCHKGSHFQASNSPKSSFSGENNENDIRQDKMDSKSQNSKKPLHKHFMSPTVSATSRGVVSGKKVLGDKNESAGSSDVQFQKSPSLDSGSGLVRPATSHPARSYSGVFSASNSTSQFDGDELDTSVGDFSVRPYDPLTNYLSPRPQYLRYKPNRRRQILDRKQCLHRKEDGAFLERSSSFESYNVVENIKPLDCVRDFLNPPSGEVTATLHNQETVRAENDDDEEEEEKEEEEDIEEFEEEKRCSLNGILKFFLLLVVIGLSTSYISSVNSPRMLLMQLQGLKDGCYRVTNHSLEAIPTNLCVGNDGVIRCMQAGDSQVGFSGVNQHSGYQDLGKVQTAMDDEDSVVMDSGDDFVRMLESEIVSSESSLMDHDNHEGPDDSMPEEAWLKLMKARCMDFGPIVTACIGFSILVILLASLVYINPARTPSKASQPSRVHFEESKQKEKLIQVKPHGEIECLQKKLESISISLEETRNEFSYNQAPKIDLIGELVIGKVSSSPIKICGRESKKNETEESKAISHADSRARSTSPAQSSAPDTGSADSPSYGSFTAEKKILRWRGISRMEREIPLYTVYLSLFFTHTYLQCFILLCTMKYQFHFPEKI